MNIIRLFQAFTSDEERSLTILEFLKMKKVLREKKNLSKEEIGDEILTLEKKSDQTSSNGMQLIWKKLH